MILTGILSISGFRNLRMLPGSELHDLAKTAFRPVKTRRNSRLYALPAGPLWIIGQRQKKAKDRVSDLRRSDSDRQRVSLETSSEHKQDFQQSLF